MSNQISARQQHEKELVAMRYWLLGREYHTALAAMEFAREYHCGLRKDNISPEFSHQIFQANFVRTLLPSLLHAEDTIAVAFLHDICEDYGYDVSFEEIEKLFGQRIAHSVRLITKKYRGETVAYEDYFARMAKDPISSIVKGTDRAHNIFTMHGAAWNVEKKEAYLDEVDGYFLPMIKIARRTFSRQEPAYENLKTLLLVQSAHIRLGFGKSVNPEAEQSTP